MGPSALALLGYAAWTILLVVCIGLQRGSLTFFGNRAPNSFKTDGTDISPFGQRLARAHRHRRGEQHRIDRDPIAARRLAEPNPAIQQTILGQIVKHGPASLRPVAGAPGRA